MALTAKWSSRNEAVIEWEITGSWQLEDYLNVIQSTQEMFQQKPTAQLNILMDLQDTHVFPKGVLSAIVHSHRSNFLPYNYGVAVLISNQLAVQHIFPVLQATIATQGRFYLVDTPEAAWQVLQEMQA